MPDTDKKVWLVTGAGRGVGVDIAKVPPSGSVYPIRARRHSFRQIHRGKS